MPMRVKTQTTIYVQRPKPRTSIVVYSISNQDFRQFLATKKSTFDANKVAQGLHAYYLFTSNTAQIQD